jgi:hypothetical protein
LRPVWHTISPSISICLNCKKYVRRFQAQTQLLNAPGYAATCLNRKEIKGANVGATGTGIWQFDGTTFTISWVSPGGGRAEWISKSVNQNYIEDGTNTVENAPGGTWFAKRVTVAVSGKPRHLSFQAYTTCKPFYSLWFALCTIILNMCHKDLIKPC